ncbi:MAG: riboflavin biosynthesis protein RibF [Chloroflexi bacterium]|nr:MAG: riboflavin biosynthesis protein RibF [Chloroflexota bacterium]
MRQRHLPALDRSRSRSQAWRGRIPGRVGSDRIWAAACEAHPRAGGDGQAGPVGPGAARAGAGPPSGPRLGRSSGRTGTHRSPPPHLRSGKGPELKIHRGLPNSPIGPVAVTVGSFDGVHLGHADVIRRTVAAARQADAQPALITFEPHPRCVLDPANCPQSITTLQEKLALLEAAGIEHAIVLTFDRALSSLSPSEFVDRLKAVMDLRRWVVGFDFAFGRQRAGNSEWLRSNGFEVDVVPPFTFEGKSLHSSDIRRLVNIGDLEEANRLLGREYSMAGPVEAGDKVGRRLGFPTANIAVEPNKLIPALGAYAGRARAAEGDFIAALSVGYRPTFGGTQLRVEGFLLDFEGDLYQRRLELRFLKYLHPDIRFDTPADLVQQLKRDVADTRRLVQPLAR